MVPPLLLLAGPSRLSSKIVRIFHLPPPLQVLLLDEPTSALDTESTSR